MLKFHQQIPFLACICLVQPFWLSQTSNIQPETIPTATGAPFMVASQRTKPASTINLTQSTMASRCYSLTKGASHPSTASTVLRSKMGSITSQVVTTSACSLLTCTSSVIKWATAQARENSLWTMEWARPRSEPSGATSSSR